MERKQLKTVLLTAAIASSMLVVGQATAQVYQISMPLGGTSGTFYAQGAALADFINSRTDNLRIVPSSSGGSVENVRLVGSGQGEFALALEADIFQAWEGQGVFERSYTEYRLLGPAQETLASHLVVLASSDVDELKDLRGHDVVSGAPGSGSASDIDALFQAVGIWEDINVSYHSWNEVVRMLTDGDIESFNRVSGVPSSFFQEIDASHPIRVLDLGNEIESSGFLDQYPYFTKVTIPAGTYSGQDNDAVTFGQGAQWIAHQDVPDEVVREFMELAYSEEAIEHLDRTVPVHDHRNTEWLNRLHAPLHPAAAEFWAERGHEIPEPLQQ